MEDKQLREFLSYTLKADGKETFIELFLYRGKEYLKKGDHKNAIRMFENVLRKDSNNIEAKKILAECEQKLNEYNNIFSLIKNFFAQYYPDESKRFEIYWNALSTNKEFMQGKKYSLSGYGLGFSEDEKDLTLTIFEIMIHLINKGVMEKHKWSKQKLENWLKLEVKKKGGKEELQNKTFEYYQSILLCL